MCADYVRRIRELRWQAMEVRWEATEDSAFIESALTTDAIDGILGGLPQPFKEISESSMGIAATLCDTSGIGRAFRETVLKLSQR